MGIGYNFVRTVALAAAFSTADASAAKSAELHVTAFVGYAEDVDRPDSAHPLAPGEPVVYRVENACYGWLMKFDPVAGPVELDELLTIPGSARHWNGDGATQVAKDRASATTRVVADGTSGVALNTWCVAEGDPEGEYSFVVSRAGHQLGSVSFRVERPAI